MLGLGRLDLPTQVFPQADLAIRRGVPWGTCKAHEAARSVALQYVY